MKIFVIVALVFLSSAVYPQSQQFHSSDNSAVLSGEDYAFAISVPKGWVCEAGSGTWVDAKALLHPRDVPKSTILWGNPDAWVTVRIADKRAEGKNALQKIIEFFAKVDSQEVSTVSNLPNLLTKDKKPVLMKQKNGARLHGAISYVEDKTIVAVFELRRYDRQQFDDAFPTFKQIVASYRSVSSDKKPGK